MIIVLYSKLFYEKANLDKNLPRCGKSLAGNRKVRLSALKVLLSFAIF